MAQGETGERTEAPTERRLREARDRGDVARSTELSAAGLLLGSMLGLRWFGRDVMEYLALIVQRGLDMNESPAQFVEGVSTFGIQVIIGAAAAVLPFMLLLAALAILINVAQVGPLWSLQPLQPKFDKLNPLSGVSRLFSMRSLVQLAVNLIKLTLVGWFAYDAIFGDMLRIILAQELEDVGILIGGAELCYQLGMRVAMLLLALAVLDYGYHRWQHDEDLKMTKQELREELKSMDGDPMLKQRRRQIQMQIAARRLQRDVPKADVVVTNPTHYAVALQYDEKTMVAPIVLAKGVDDLARRIRELAMAHNIPIVERRALAQALYRGVEVGQEVPADLYKAVAEILAYVYELGGTRRKKRASA